MLIPFVDCSWFLSSVWTAIIGLLLFFLYALSLLVVYFIGEDASLLRYNCPFPGNLSACDPDLHVLGVELPTQANPVLPALCAVSAVLALIGLGFLVHLASFHIYLSESHTDSACFIRTLYFVPMQWYFTPEIRTPL